MATLEKIDTLQTRYTETLAQAESFAGTHRTLLQTAGLVTAVALGGAGGFLLAKGALAVKAGMIAQTVPLLAGIVSGGAVGIGATRYQVHRVREELALQIAQSGIIQAERDRLVHLLAATQASLEPLQTKPVEQVVPPIPSVETGPCATRVTPSTAIATNGMAKDGMADSVMNAILLDRLEAINGLTPAMAARLNQAGILTYTDLAGQTVSQVQQLLPIESQLTGQTVATWLVTARALSTQ